LQLQRLLPKIPACENSWLKMGVAGRTVAVNGKIRKREKNVKSRKGGYGENARLNAASNNCKQSDLLRFSREARPRSTSFQSDVAQPLAPRCGALFRLRTCTKHHWALKHLQMFVAAFHAEIFGGAG
jgi:hypothetical protein